MEQDQKIAVPLPTIRRLPLYFGILNKLSTAGKINISSAAIAEELNLEAIQVRKDLTAIGITGQPGVGFDVKTLQRSIVSFLGWNNTTDAVIIGAGHLGSALAGYKGFKSNGLNIDALFDNDPAKIDTEIHGVKVFSVNRLKTLTQRMQIHIGILAVPAENAQGSAEILVNSGIKAIWNFTPVKISVDPSVIVERVDLAASLAVLSSKLAKKLGA